MTASGESRATRRGWDRLLPTIAADRAANRRDPKAQFVLVALRLCQSAMGDLDRPRLLSLPLVALYRLTTEWGLGLELRPKTSVGPGLSLFHGYGLVINDHARIRAHVQLRHGVTIGHARRGGGSPTIEDGVEIGAGAIIIGDIVVGKNARIGAGAVVTRSVPAGAVAIGNPATIRLATGEPSL